MSVRQHSAQEDGALMINDAISCGCFSPHALGNKKGGLEHFEDNLVGEWIGGWVGGRDGGREGGWVV